MAEWLRRWTANPMGSARVGSNPILVDILVYLKLALGNEKNIPVPGIEPEPAG